MNLTTVFPFEYRNLVETSVIVSIVFEINFAARYTARFRLCFQIFDAFIFSSACNLFLLFDVYLFPTVAFVLSRHLSRKNAWINQIKIGATMFTRRTHWI